MIQVGSGALIVSSENDGEMFYLRKARKFVAVYRLEVKE